MGGFSAECKLCGKWYTQGFKLVNHMRDKHNIGGHKGGVPRAPGQVSDHWTWWCKP